MEAPDQFIGEFPIKLKTKNFTKDFLLKKNPASLARAVPSLARAVLKPFYRTSAADLLPPACKARSAGCEKSEVSEVSEVNESDPF